MRSIRSKITLLTVVVIIITVFVATTISIISIKDTGMKNSRQLLRLMCETGQKNLDMYFISVEHSVEMLSSFIQQDLDGTDDEHLVAHMERARQLFNRAVQQTYGVLTYYYRIDPAISQTEKGFWYIKARDGFEERAVTDITEYDTSDTSALVWFTMPKFEGKAVWLPPYITENLGARVISYNVPVYYGGRFVGVIGIEIDYSTMAREVDHIQLYESGYAFVNDAEGNLVYHPYMDVPTLEPEDVPATPLGISDSSQYVTYTYEGVQKQGFWLPLANGMRLNVAVPVDEINRDWKTLIREILLASTFILLIAALIAARLTRRITKPLYELIAAAKEVDNGNFDVKLDYEGNDEIGLLTHTMNGLVRHLKVNISDLNRRATIDALTLVRNKGAFYTYVQELQAKVEADPNAVKFAVAAFDCDDLKHINDTYGHDRGDQYLTEASHLICRVFKQSPVFRVGGDEFAAILEGEDYDNREELFDRFREYREAICAYHENEWEQVRVTMGLAVYDPASDVSVDDVARRADMIMYENKRKRKEARAQAQAQAAENSKTDDRQISLDIEGEV